MLEACCRGPTPAALSGVAGLVMCALPASNRVCCQLARPSDGLGTVFGLTVSADCNHGIVGVVALQVAASNFVPAGRTGCHAQPDVPHSRQ